MIMKLLKDSKVRGTYDAYKVTEFIKYLAYKGVINFETYSIISKCLYGRVANYSEYEHHSLLFYMLMSDDILKKEGFTKAEDKLKKLYSEGIPEWFDNRLRNKLSSIKKAVIVDGKMFYIEYESGKNNLYVVEHSEDKSTDFSKARIILSNVKNWLQYCEETKYVYCKAENDSEYYRIYVDTEEITIVPDSILVDVGSKGKEYFIDSNQTLCYNENNRIVRYRKIDVEKMDFEIMNPVLFMGEGIMVMPKYEHYDVFPPYILFDKGTRFETSILILCWRWLVRALAKYDVDRIGMKEICLKVEYYDNTQYTVCDMKDKLLEMKQLEWFDSKKIDNMLEIINLLGYDEENHNYGVIYFNLWKYHHLCMKDYATTSIADDEFLQLLKSKAEPLELTYLLEYFPEMVFTEGDKY